jgi:hypothetical protein
MSDSPNDIFFHNLGLDPNFSSTRYQIPNDWLLDPSHEMDIFAAHVNYTTRYLAALYTQTLRRTYDQPAEVDLALQDVEDTWAELIPIRRAPSGPLSATKPDPVMGTFKNPGVQRVVQNRASTFVLVVLLFVLLGLNTAAILRGVSSAVEKDVLPEDPGTIAAMARLRGSNFFDHLEAEGRQKDAMITEDELHGAIEGGRLRLGFWKKGTEKDAVYRLGVVDAHDLNDADGSFHGSGTDRPQPPSSGAASR